MATVGNNQRLGPTPLSIDIDDDDGMNVEPGHRQLAAFNDATRSMGSTGSLPAGVAQRQEALDQFMNGGIIARPTEIPIPSRSRG